MKMYSAFVSRTLTWTDPAKPEVHILEADLAGFEIDGRQMLRKTNGTYEPNDGSWFSSRKEAVAKAIETLRERISQFEFKIAELRKELD